MGRRREPINDVNEVVEIKRREIAAGKGEEVPVSEELAAKRQDMDALERMEAEKKAARTPVDVAEAFEDDLISEEAIAADREAELIAKLTATLKVPKTRDSVPTFSMYSIGQMRRYFIMDVDGTAFRRGWAMYKEAKGDDPVGYIDMVMHIMDLEIPRLHRAVDWAPLNRPGAYKYHKPLIHHARPGRHRTAPVQGAGTHQRAEGLSPIAVSPRPDPNLYIPLRVCRYQTGRVQRLSRTAITSAS